MRKTIIQCDKDVSVKEMGDLEPLEFGVVINGDYQGHLVMRTASVNKFEVIDLTAFGPDHCWTIGNDLLIKLIPKAQLTLIQDL